MLKSILEVKFIYVFISITFIYIYTIFDYLNRDTFSSLFMFCFT